MHYLNNAGNAFIIVTKFLDEYYPTSHSHINNMTHCNCVRSMRICKQNSPRCQETCLARISPRETWYETGIYSNESFGTERNRSVRPKEGKAVHRVFFSTTNWVSFCRVRILFRSSFSPFLPGGFSVIDTFFHFLTRMELVLDLSQNSTGHHSRCFPFLTTHHFEELQCTLLPILTDLIWMIF